MPLGVTIVATDKAEYFVYDCIGDYKSPTEPVYIHIIERLRSKYNTMFYTASEMKAEFGINDAELNGLFSNKIAILEDGLNVIDAMFPIHNSYYTYTKGDILQHRTLFEQWLDNKMIAKLCSQ